MLKFTDHSKGEPKHLRLFVIWYHISITNSFYQQPWNCATCNDSTKFLRNQGLQGHSDIHENSNDQTSIRRTKAKSTSCVRPETPPLQFTTCSITQLGHSILDLYGNTVSIEVYELWIKELISLECWEFLWTGVRLGNLSHFTLSCLLGLRSEMTTMP